MCSYKARAVWRVLDFSLCQDVTRSYNQLWSRVRHKQHAAAHTSLNELFFFSLLCFCHYFLRYIWSQDSCLTYVSVKEGDQVWVVIYWNGDNLMSCDRSNPSFCWLWAWKWCLFEGWSVIYFSFSMHVTVISLTGSGIYVKAVIKLSWFNTHQASADSFTVGVGV